MPADQIVSTRKGPNNENCLRCSRAECIIETPPQCLENLEGSRDSPSIASELCSFKNTLSSFAVPQPSCDSLMSTDSVTEDRFAFGENWLRFLETIDETRLDAATDGLRQMLGVDRLDGKTFLDVGCGSGLSSLAAVRLGASVLSFDYDPSSVACSRELKRRFAADDARWTIEQGSALDAAYMASLGKFDIAYSWGVLHHTGDQWAALKLVVDRVAPHGLLFIALYHDQGSASRRWKWIKRIYQSLHRSLKPLWVLLIAGWYEGKFALARLARGKNPLPFADWQSKKRDRGMSVWHDWVDWIGGWPFEVASPDQVINPLASRGFCLQRIKTVGNGWGCNEYVFRYEPPAN